MRSNQNFLMSLCCVAAMCSLRVLDSVMTIWNHLGFTYVAIYGYEYAQAGREAFTLVKAVGLTPLVNMLMLQGVSLFGCAVRKSRIDSAIPCTVWS
jgi:hypothetical protein